MALFVNLPRRGNGGSAHLPTPVSSNSLLASAAGRDDASESPSESEEDLFPASEVQRLAAEDEYLELTPDDVDITFVRFNISGRRFKIASDIIERAPENSLLRNLQHEAWYLSKRTQEYILDRNPSVFHAILEYLRTYQLHIPSGMCRAAFAKELEFYGLHENLLSPCCRKKLSHREQRRLALREKKFKAACTKWKSAARRALAKHRLETGAVDAGNMCALLAP